MSNSKMSEALTRVLGNSYILYVKTHGYHWNVTGLQFHSLHNLFEEQYREMWDNLDILAERIRALGAMAPSSSRAMGEAGSLEEQGADVPGAQDMLRNLIADHDKWLEDANDALEQASEEGDAGSEDVLTPLISAHEKMRWMLKSSLGE